MFVIYSFLIKINTSCPFVLRFSDIKIVDGKVKNYIIYQVRGLPNAVYIDFNFS